MKFEEKSRIFWITISIIGMITGVYCFLSPLSFRLLVADYEAIFGYTLNPHNILQYPLAYRAYGIFGMLIGVILFFGMIIPKFKKNDGGA